MTVTIASRDSAREVSRSRSRIWNARVAGKAEPLWGGGGEGRARFVEGPPRARRVGAGAGGGSYEDSMMMRSGWYFSVLRVLEGESG
jgi:hypothetical protein